MRKIIIEVPDEYCGNENETICQYVICHWHNGFAVVDYNKREDLISIYCPIYKKPLMWGNDFKIKPCKECLETTIKEKK